MRWSLISLVLVAAACGGKKSSTAPAGDGDGAGTGPVVTAQTILGWGTSGYNPEAQTPKTSVFLEVTDHHGATLSYPLGDIPAPCSAGPGNGSDIITTLLCVTPGGPDGGTGAQYRAVYRGGAEIIVLRRWVNPGDDPGDIELSFQEVSRVPVATGAKVKPAA